MSPEFNAATRDFAWAAEALFSLPVVYWLTVFSGKHLRLPGWVRALSWAVVVVAAVRGVLSLVYHFA